MECVFCEIVARRAPARIVAEDALTICLLDIQPLAEGHCLVVPKRHVPWWHDLTEEETVSAFLMAKRVANRLSEVLQPDFVCLYARGRRIPHTHLFLVPSVKNDVLDAVFNALEKVQESPSQLAALKEERAMDAAVEKITTS